MKKPALLRTRLLIALSLIFATQTYASPAPKPFKRAIIFRGMMANTSVFLGMLEALRSQGQAPDLIIGICGGSFAAAIANREVGASAQMSLVQSPEMHAFLRSFKPSQNATTTGMMSLIAEIERTQLLDTVPDYFSKYLFEIDEAIPTVLSQFKTPKGAPKIIIIATRTLFKPRHVGQLILGRPLFEETYFTDPETAQAIPSWITEISKHYPKSRVTPYAKVKTDWPVIDAVRASITDTFIFKPLERDGQYYMAGSIDLYPVELAKSLADEVITHI